MDYTDKIIKDQFESLPPEVKRALSQVSWQNEIARIAALERLTADQAVALETETMLILYGFLSPETYIDNLVKNVQIDEERAAKIANEVSEGVFEKLEQEFKKLTEKAAAEEATVQKTALEIPPQNLPMIEEGEVVHDVPHQEPITTTSTPTAVAPIVQETSKVEMKKEEPPIPSRPAAPAYVEGKDPYREPLV